MKTKFWENFSRTRLPVKFIPAEPIHPVYTDGSGPLNIRIDGLLLNGYVCSSDAADIDRGIRNSLKGIRLSILAMGFGLAKIKKYGLYKDLNCTSMIEYINRLCEETKMYRGSIYNWLYIGEAYIKYRNDLEQVGFTDNDGPSKLPYLERALAVNQRQDVFNNVKNMSLREFISFAKSQGETGTAAAADKRTVTFRGNTILIDGKPAIKISKKLDSETSSYLKKVLRAACESLARV